MKLVVLFATDPCTIRDELLTVCHYDAKTWVKEVLYMWGLSIIAYR